MVLACILTQCRHAIVNQDYLKFHLRQLVRASSRGSRPLQLQGMDALHLFFSKRASDLVQSHVCSAFTKRDA